MLVILGLLVGGVLSGQSLIRAAELRAVSTEYSRWVTSAQTFRDKYFALPGDMPNATAFWGTAASCPGDETTPSSGTATCNGNGDGMVGTLPTSYEYHRFWQQLANAALIEGTYTGVRITSALDFSFQRGVNVPASKLSNAAWFVNNATTAAISSNALFEGQYDNILAIGNWLSTANNNGGSNQKTFKPEEAWNIDTKIDDGNNTTGKVRTWEWDNPGCNTIARSNTLPLVNVATYNLTTNSVQCNLVFPQAF